LSSFGNTRGEEWEVELRWSNRFWNELEREDWEGRVGFADHCRRSDEWVWGWTQLENGSCSSGNGSGGLTQCGEIGVVNGWADLCQRCICGVCAVVGDRALVQW